MLAPPGVLLAAGRPWGDSHPSSLPAEQVVDLPVTLDPIADHAEAARWRAAGIHVRWMMTAPLPRTMPSPPQQQQQQQPLASSAPPPTTLPPNPLPSAASERPLPARRRSDAVVYIIGPVRSPSPRFSSPARPFGAPSPGPPPSSPSVPHEASQEEYHSEQEWYEPWDGPAPLEEDPPSPRESEEAPFIDLGSEPESELDPEPEPEPEPETETGTEPETEQPESESESKTETELETEQPEPESKFESEPSPSPSPPPPSSPAPPRPSPEHSPEPSPPPSPAPEEPESPPPPAAKPSKGKTPLYKLQAPRSPSPSPAERSGHSYSLAGASLAGAVHAMPRRADFHFPNYAPASSADSDVRVPLDVGQELATGREKACAGGELGRLVDEFVARGDGLARRCKERACGRKIGMLRRAYEQVARGSAEVEAKVEAGKTLSRAQKKRLKKREEAARKKALKEAEAEEKTRRKAASAAREGGAAGRLMAPVQKVAGGRRQAKKRPGAKKAGKKDGEKGPDGGVVATTTTTTEETEQDDGSRGRIAMMVAALQKSSEEADEDTEDDEDTQVDVYKLLQLRTRALFGSPLDGDANETGGSSRAALRRSASMEALFDVEQDNEVLSDDERTTVEDVSDDCNAD